MVTDLLELKTVAGDITLNDCFGIEASRLKVSTVSGSIGGDFALLKSVELYAASYCPQNLPPISKLRTLNH